MEVNIIKTGSGSIWDFNKSVRSSIFKVCKELGYYPVCRLTGKFNDHKNYKGEIWSEIEVLDQYGEGGFINEQFVSQ
jgi:hypothetical protein